jgi:hypothetical protein
VEITFLLPRATEPESWSFPSRGRYFHPLLGTLISGGARPMLAIAETRAVEIGFDWAFCDTDSMALARSNDMSEADFYSRAQSICSWFMPLNSYS